MSDFVESFLREHTPQMLEDLGALCAIESVDDQPQEGKPFGEQPYRALQCALQICRRLGFATRDIDGYVGEADLCEGEPVLGILCHLDVVAAGEGWRVKPYALTREGDTLLGRGVIDDKGPFVAALYGMVLAREQAKKEGKKLQNVRLIFGTNEEKGSGDMEYYVTKRSFPPRVFTPDGDFPVIHMEKGMLHAGFALDADSAASKKGAHLLFVKGGDTVNAVPGKATCAIAGIPLYDFERWAHAFGRGCSFTARVAEHAKDLTDFAPSGWEVPFPEDMQPVLLVTANGKSAHASTPKLGVNALAGLLLLLSSLPLCAYDLKRLGNLCALFPFGETNGASVGLDMADEPSGALTLAFSTLTLTPEKTVGMIDIRFPVTGHLHQITDLLARALAAHQGRLTTQDGSEPHAVSPDSPFVQTLLAVYERETGLPGECIAIGGGTYVHHIEGGVAFGANFPGEDNHMHGANEWISLDKWLLTTRIYAAAVYELAAGEK